MQYRTEHPKPQFQRERWRNLNGDWAFENDPGNSGEDRGMARADASAYSQTIRVPFCPQSKLSGIGNTDFFRSVWYRRAFSLEETETAGRVLLHFGAVDYRATVFVNGQKAGTHNGGYVSFSLDITPFVKTGDNILVVHAEDDERDPMIPSGKQSVRYASGGCFYTRTTGIWQTVWLEFVPETHIAGVRYYPNVQTAALTVLADLNGRADFTVTASFEGKPMGTVTLPGASGQVTLTLPLKETHLWELGKGGLYDLTLSFGEDTVQSYFGLRSIEYTDHRFLLNGRPVFQRLVLDQGFYPDGIYTASSDAELAGDVDRSMAMGFNGARLHEKVFEERFLYHCDRKGYLVWGEYPNWGLDQTDANAVYGILPEWLEEVKRDFNHPAIVGWCPFNETFERYEPLLALVHRATKAVDPTRPCIDTSGYCHVETDIFDVHCYEQNPETFASYYANLSEGKLTDPLGGRRQTYDGKIPFFVSEYGGIRWSTDAAGWGYGDSPKTEEEFLARLKGLTDALLDNPYVFALCYTQLTDVEQEQNGLYTYDRRAKFPPETIRTIFARPAACETNG